VVPRIPVAGFAIEAAAAVAIALMLASLDRGRRRAGVLDWALGLCSLAAALVLAIVASVTGPPARVPIGLAASLLFALWPTLTLLGTWARLTGRGTRRLRVTLVAAVSALLLAVYAASAAAGPAAGAVQVGVRMLLTGLAHLVAGAALLWASRGRSLFGTRVLAASYLCSSLEETFFVGLAARSGPPESFLAPDLIVHFEFLALSLCGVGMVSWLLEDERERALRLHGQLRQREAFARMGALVAGVAHQARNPLFAISATLDAQERRGGPSPHARALREHAGRLAALMRDLLDYGRPPALELRTGALEDVAQQAIGATGAQAGSAGVTVQLAGSPGVPPVRVDGARLAEALQNLVQNAIEHSPRGSRVTVALRAESRDGVAGACCSVRDEGPGFAPEHLPRVFEPFFTRRKNGTGLGLAIVRRIVEEHEGRVEAANDGAGGGLVRFWLPAAGSVARPVER
jgi:signal transduction histidine kinase